MSLQFSFPHFGGETRYIDLKWEKEDLRSQNDNTLQLSGGSLFPVPVEPILHGDLKSDTSGQEN